MGAGILPVALHNNELYFLFGKENRFEKSAPGFADFGGGTEPGETYLQTALREGSEELTGFLGDQKELKQRLNKSGTFNLDYKHENTEKMYRTFIFPLDYDDKLVYYYNNNQRFIQKHLDPKVIQNTRIFEKSEIRWFSLKDMKKEIHVFRPFYQNIVKNLLEKQEYIRKFMDKKSFILRKGKKSKTRKNNII
jgi:8-oxo-dGTP pyrophosphatase MutT (NUDIX family)